jgi:hypothetical protein
MRSEALQFCTPYNLDPTPMVQYAKPDPSDDPKFLDWVESVVVGVEKRFKTDQTFVVKIDNWFGKRWLGFSGKTLGIRRAQDKANAAAFHPFARRLAVSVLARRGSCRTPARPPCLPAERGKPTAVRRGSRSRFQHILVQRELVEERPRQLHGLPINARWPLALVRGATTHEELASCRGRRHWHSRTQGL